MPANDELAIQVDSGCFLTGIFAAGGDGSQGSPVWSMVTINKETNKREAKWYFNPTPTEKAGKRLEVTKMQLKSFYINQGIKDYFHDQKIDFPWDEANPEARVRLLRSLVWLMVDGKVTTFKRIEDGEDVKLEVGDAELEEMRLMAGLPDLPTAHEEAHHTMEDDDDYDNGDGVDQFEGDTDGVAHAAGPPSTRGSGGSGAHASHDDFGLDNETLVDEATDVTFDDDTTMGNTNDSGVDDQVQIKEEPNS